MYIGFSTANETRAAPVRQIAFSTMTAHAQNHIALQRSAYLQTAFWTAAGHTQGHTAAQHWTVPVRAIAFWMAEVRKQDRIEVQHVVV